MKLISHFAVVFPVEDVKATTKYYINNLGFEVRMKMDDYAVIHRDEAIQIHLTKQEDDFQPSKNHTSVYVFTPDVDAIYREFKSKEVKLLNEPTTWEYGMRDFDLIDINGYRLTFGQGIS